jgi:hypothetical protein
MRSVTVDLDDLETLVMTTGALKTIEGALQARKADPFVREHLEFTAAHDRLATAMRNAMRADAGTLVPWDGELEDDEVKMLRRIDEDIFAEVDMQRRTKSDEELTFYHKPLIDRLVAKGCVEPGKCLRGIHWATETKPTISIKNEIYFVRITDRGRQKLAALDAKKPEVVT